MPGLQAPRCSLEFSVTMCLGEQLGARYSALLLTYWKLQALLGVPSGCPGVMYEMTLWEMYLAEEGVHPLLLAHQGSHLGLQRCISGKLDGNAGHLQCCLARGVGTFDRC